MMKMKNICFFAMLNLFSICAIGAETKPKQQHFEFNFQNSIEIGHLGVMAGPMAELLFPVGTTKSRITEHLITWSVGPRLDVLLGVGRTYVIEPQVALKAVTPLTQLGNHRVDFVSTFGLGYSWNNNLVVNANRYAHGLKVDYGLGIQLFLTETFAITVESGLAERFFFANTTPPPMFVASQAYFAIGITRS